MFRREFLAEFNGMESKDIRNNINQMLESFFYLELYYYIGLLVSITEIKKFPGKTQ